MSSGFKLIVEKPINLLIVLIEEFFGSHLSLEGQFSDSDFSQIPGVSRVPTEVLVRNTLWPQQDFVILPIEPDTKEAIKQILPQLNFENKILHVLLEKNNKLVFAAYDSFHPDCVWISKIVSLTLLETLIIKKIISHYEEDE
jgi:hypothetical protein